MRKDVIANRITQYTTVPFWVWQCATVRKIKKTFQYYKCTEQSTCFLSHYFSPSTV